MKTKLNVEYVAIVAKFNDGKCRQILANEDDINEMLEVMYKKYGGLKYTRDVLQGIDFELPETKTK